MTALNYADKVALGAAQASAVYLGATKVWPSFKPTDLSGCRIWADASRLGLGNGASVTTWPNLGLAGGAAAIVGTPTPTFRTNALNILMPVVRITHGAQFRFSNTGIDKDYTLLFVARRWTLQPGRIVSVFYVDGTTPNILWGFWSDRFECAYVEGWMVPDVIVTATLQWRLYSADAITGGTARMFSNGTLLRSHPSPPPKYGVAGSLILGGYNDAHSEDSDCEIAEVIMYNRQLSDTERQTVENYLRTKWAAPTLFKPTDLGTNLLGWFDASDAASVQISGSGVSNWVNKGVSTLTLSQSNDAWRPTYANNTVTLTSPQQLAAANSPTSYDAILVGRPNPSSNGEWRTLLRSTASGGLHHIIIETGALRMGAYNGGNGFCPATGLTWDNVWGLGYGQFGTGPIMLSRDGGALTSTGTTPVATDVPVVSFGAYQGPPPSQSWGDIKEIIFLPYASSDSTRQILEGYFAWKWGLVDSFQPVTRTRTQHHREVSEMLDFPSSPTVGQKYPSPSVAGVPTYTWDGEKWSTASNGSTGGGVTQTYVDTQDALRVAKAGDVMTGNLTLTVTPLATNHAVNKGYTDTADALKVAKAGDTMTGQLALPTGPAAANAVRKDYVDAGDTAATAVANTKVAKAGDTMTGLLVLSPQGLGVGDATDITQRISSGFYQNSTTSTATGWPVNGGWHHLIACTHSNAGNYYSLQLSATFAGTNNTLYWRETEGVGTTAWRSLWDSGNFNPASYVAKAGDTMSGSLTINGNQTVNGTGFYSSSLTSNGPFTASGNATVGYSLSIGATSNACNLVMGTQGYRWAYDGGSFVNWNGGVTISGGLDLGSANGPTRVLSLDGANQYISFNYGGAEGFLIGKEGDNSTGRLLIYKSGTYCMTMSAAGATAWSNNMTVNGIIATSAYLNVNNGGGDYGLIYFGNTANARYLEQNGARYNWNGGAVYLSNYFYATNHCFYDNGSMGMFYGGADTIIRQTTNFWMQDTGGNWKAYVDGNGAFNCQGNIGINGALTTQQHMWTNLQGYKPGGGSWADTSDIRIKNVLGDYEKGLDEILALQPKKFTYKGNDTVDVPSGYSPVDAQANKALKIEEREAPTVPYRNSGHYHAAVDQREFTGLIAQDAELVMPELVTLNEGYIDGVKVTDLREVDTTPLVYAMINAIKTLTTRIELLEGQLASRALR